MFGVETLKKTSLIAAFVALAILAAVLGSGSFRPQAVQAAANPAVISVFGMSDLDGETVVVHVMAVVHPGADARSVAAQVLRENNARPFDSADFRTTGLVWDQFSDSNGGNDVVELHYNSRNQPSSNAKSQLTAAQASWNITPSSFEFYLGNDTTRCPSLVKECRRQSFDGYNDVGWLKLGGCCTLAVTWYSTTTDEADMVANTNFKWSFTCGSVAGRFDYQTVMLHELGHILGLAHSDVTGSTMYATYQTSDCSLSQDDIDGVVTLYPRLG